jgi:hypothetical protein
MRIVQEARGQNSTKTCQVFFLMGASCLQLLLLFLTILLAFSSRDSGIAEQRIVICYENTTTPHHTFSAQTGIAPQTVIR